jgi:hypothetical protein
VHAGRHIAVHASRDPVLPLGSRLREEAADVEERQQRGDHDVLGADDAVALDGGRPDDRATGMLVHVHRACVLEDQAPVADQRASESDEVCGGRTPSSTAST